MMRGRETALKKGCEGMKEGIEETANDIDMMIESLEYTNYATREELEGKPQEEIKAMFYQMRSEID